MVISKDEQNQYLMQFTHIPQQFIDNQGNWK